MIPVVHNITEIEEISIDDATFLSIDYSDLAWEDYVKLLLYCVEEKNHPKMYTGLILIKKRKEHSTKPLKFVLEYTGLKKIKYIENLILLADIERVEIVREPVLGTAGIIQFITKDWSSRSKATLMNFPYREDVMGFRAAESSIAHKMCDTINQLIRENRILSRADAARILEEEK